ncbi:MAG: class I SAM-dependent methyltransferase [Steroidobacteraceae bacterium]
MSDPERPLAAMASRAARRLASPTRMMLAAAIGTIAGLGAAHGVTIAAEQSTPAEATHGASAASTAVTTAGTTAGTTDRRAAAPVYEIPAYAPSYVRRAIESPERPAAQRARDAGRKPAEILMMSGIKPGDRVIEFASFGQYYTRLLSDIVGRSGRVYMFDLPYTEKRAGAASRAFVAAHPNSKYTVVNYNSVQLPRNVDIVYMVLYYHDLSINHIDTARLNERILAALKPGGIFLIVDHNARPGSGRSDTQALHRIDPAVIRKEVTAAGFELVKESHLLANPADDHTLLVFKPSIRGRTDRTIFVFRKPFR